MSRLEVLSPPSLRGESRDLWGGSVLVGRGPDADWRIDEPTVSRRHAVIRHFADHDEIEDLGSMAGTRVNGRPITGAAVLRPGDVIELATARLRYLADDDEVAGPSPPQSSGTPAETDRAAFLTVLGIDEGPVDDAGPGPGADRARPSSGSIPRALVLLGVVLAVLGAVLLLAGVGAAWGSLALVGAGLASGALGLVLRKSSADREPRR